MPDFAYLYHNFTTKLRAALIPKDIRTKLHLLRVSRPLTSLLGTRYPTYFGRIELDITFDCNLGCQNCNKSCGHNQAPSLERMSVGQIEEFIKENTAARKKWKIIAITGGEPTRHPQLGKIAGLLCDYRNKHMPKTFIEIFTNGFGEETKKILSSLPEEIIIRNSAKKSIHNKFTAFNLAPIDDDRYKNAEFINGCGMTGCGITLGPYGYYFCGVAECIDRVLGLDIGMKKLQLKESKEFKNQRALLCRYCGYFKGNGRNFADKTTISDFWLKTYQRYKQNPPLLKRWGPTS